MKYFRFLQQQLLQRWECSRHSHRNCYLYISQDYVLVLHLVSSPQTSAGKTNGELTHSPDNDVIFQTVKQRDVLKLITVDYITEKKLFLTHIKA